MCSKEKYFSCGPPADGSLNRPWWKFSSLERQICVSPRQLLVFSQSPSRSPVCSSDKILAKLGAPWRSLSIWTHRCWRASACLNAWEPPCTWRWRTHSPLAPLRSVALDTSVSRYEPSTLCWYLKKIFLPIHYIKHWLTNVTFVLKAHADWLWCRSQVRRQKLALFHFIPLFCSSPDSPKESSALQVRCVLWHSTWVWTVQHQLLTVI